VSELLHETADDGFHEIQLSGKQLVFLFIVTTTVIVVVFLCGVKVGRGARVALGEEPDIAAAANPAPQSIPSAAPPTTEAPAPAAETPEKLTYHERLQAQGTPAETLKPQQDAKPQEDAKPQAAAAPRPSPPAPAPPAAAPPAASATAPPAATTPVRQGTWAVQVIATRDPEVASAVVTRLSAKGYPAFLVNPPKGAAQAYYKVHVGRYNDRSEAERVSLRIKKEEQFQSWITR
jgi:cell division septation protein DedD